MLPLIILQIVLIALNAIFASAEIAVLSISEAKLEKMAQDGNRKAKRLFKLTKEPAKFLATIQVAITLSGFLGSAFAADSFSDPLVAAVTKLNPEFFAGKQAMLDSVAVVIITLVLSYFTLIFGELVPKRLAMKKSEKIAMGISGILGFISKIFRPIVWFLSVSTNLVLRLCGVDPHEAEDEVSEEEIRMMVDVGSEKGTIDHQEKEFIQNVFDFNDTTAASVTTHRKDVTVLWLDDGMEVWAETIHRTRHTLYPVCDGQTDNVTGILNAKDYFRLSDKSRENVIKEAVFPAYFVPESIKADVLFRNMKATRNSMAIVMDEYGGMVGIVTINDLVEELVGEITPDTPDESTPETSLTETAENTWEVVGNIELELLTEKTGITFDEADYDTFTGLIFDILGRIPDDGNETIEIDSHGMIITITDIQAHQVKKAKILVKPKSEDEVEDE